MTIEERYKLFQQIMWDYNISPADIEAVLSGQREKIAHYDRQAIFLKLLESYSWFTIIELFSANEIKLLLSDDVIKKLRFKSLRVKYEFVQKRLQEIIKNEDSILKIDFVNDVSYRSGNPIKTRLGDIDNVANVLSNKLIALTGRDEPKDVYDIVAIAQNYSFNWREIFYQAKEKALLNEIDIAQCLYGFSVRNFQDVDWLINPVKIDSFESHLRIINDDFLLGKENSLGEKRTLIENAKILLDGM